MKRLWGLLLFLILILAGAPAWGQSNVSLWCWSSATSSGQNVFLPCNATTPLVVSATITPSGTQDVNLTKVGGTAVSLGQALMAASIPVAIASNQSALTVTGTGGTFPVTQSTTPWVVAGSGTAGTANAGVLTVQGIASMTPVQVSQATASNLNATVVGTGTFVTQSAITAASGSFASGSQSIGITPTDRTVTSATGSSQTVASALATRKSLLIVNTGNANCGINPTGGTAAIGGAGTITLTPTGSYSPRIPTLAAVTAICTAGQPLYAEES